ncbi:nucleotide sugar dehydrogenase [Candidatus Pelagibacter ubique]|nr:nucleotide sugar dehydrogenase [Candidatus Pelagibacter ubique]
MKKSSLKIAVIGLGYVGLPLAIEFAKKRQVIGFDVNSKRINDLKLGLDKTKEVTKKKLIKSKKLFLTNSKKYLELANCYIVTVPTPIDKFRKPDLTPLLNASKMLGKVLKKNDIVIYESTVFPGCTEEKCVPILEKYSKLKFNKSFFCGYSPERNNPGDKKNKIWNIKKVTSGSNKKTASLVDSLYNEIITVGTYKAQSIKVAEASKVIENTQRDLNIAYMNELSNIFNKLNIDLDDVIKAAETKWNFLPFRPGLVGGHCIGVDPYYLIHKSKSAGYNPKVISSARNLNNKMGNNITSRFVKKMTDKSIVVKNCKILIMGLTFKENCPDLRNSGIKRVIDNLNKHKCKLDLYDPWASKNEIQKIYKTKSVNNLVLGKYDGVIIAVAHKKFKKMGIKMIKSLCKKKSVIFDLKSIFSKTSVDLNL